MANPKYIDESLLYNVNEEATDKKGVKKAYSFRCDETLLDGISEYAKLEGATMPQVLSNIMADFLADKTLTNTYLPEYESQYISIPSNVEGMYHKSFEYELRTVINNLDIWNSKYGYVSKHHESQRELYDGLLHEGIDFIVIPETIYTGKLSEADKIGLHIDYSLNLNKIPSCLYCMYITVNNCHHVEYEVIGWIDAMNKLKSVGRYDLISYGNEIKKKLEALHNDYIKDDGMYDVEMMWDAAYGRLLKIAKDYNTGAIVPASNSIDNIEYAAIVKQLPDNYDLISKLMKENKELQGMADELIAIKERMDELDNMTAEELLQSMAERRNDDLPESDDE